MAMQLPFSVTSLGVVDGLEESGELINTDGSVLVRSHDSEPEIVAVAFEVGIELVEDGLCKCLVVWHMCISFLFN